MDKLVRFKKVHKEVLQFIEDYQDIDNEYFDIPIDNQVERDRWERIYTNGNCSFLAFQIGKAFPNVKYWFTNTYSHIVAEVEGLLFDVRGVVVMDRMFSSYVPATEPALLYANCWSHDYDDGYATSDMYIKGLPAIISKPYDEWQEEIEDENLQYVFQYEIPDAVRSLFFGTDNYNVALNNGWLEHGHDYDYNSWENEDEPDNEWEEF